MSIYEFQASVKPDFSNYDSDSACELRAADFDCGCLLLAREEGWHLRFAAVRPEGEDESKSSIVFRKHHVSLPHQNFWRSLFRPHTAAPVRASDFR